MANNQKEEQVPMIIENDQLSDTADSASAVDSGFRVFTANSMEKLDESSPVFQGTKAVFVKAMGPDGGDTTVVAIHKNTASDPSMRARLMAGKMAGEAVAKKNGRNPVLKEACIRDAWYGGSKQEIAQILAHGFSGLSAPNRQSHGVGVHLNSLKYASDGALLSDCDDSGLKHILLCRVIMGKVEVIRPGSKQSCPSSKEMDSGTDNLVNPRKYIVWNAFMNSRIFPTFVISFKVAPLRPYRPIQQVASGVQTPRQPIPSGVPTKMQITLSAKTKRQKIVSADRTQQQQIAIGVRLIQSIVSGMPMTPLISFGALMYTLERHLPRSQMRELARVFLQFKRNKITRQQLVQMVRQIVGDSLLVRVIKTYITGKAVGPGKPRG